MVINGIERLIPKEKSLLESVNVIIKVERNGETIILPPYAKIHYIIKRDNKSIETCIHIDTIILIIHNYSLDRQKYITVIDSRDKDQLRSRDHDLKREVHVW